MCDPGDDMPQPLRRAKTVQFGADHVSQRPQLAIAITRIVVLWSIVETNLGRILAEILGADASIGVAMYNALVGNAGQEAVLRAVVAEKLSKDDADRFNDLLDEMRSRARERNRIVHGMWGIADTEPDKLIWQDQRVWAKTIAERFSRMRFDRMPPPLEFDPNLPSGAKGAFVYSDKDFKDIEARILKFSNELEEFAAGLFLRRLRSSIPTIPGEP